MLNKNFHHIVLLPLSAFVVSFLTPAYISAVKDMLAVEVCENDICCICNDEGSKERFCKLPCGHKFHIDCNLAWYNTISRDEKVCPICRAHIPHYLNLLKLV